MEVVSGAPHKPPNGHLKADKEMVRSGLNWLGSKMNLSNVGKSEVIVGHHNCRLRRI